MLVIPLHVDTELGMIRLASGGESDPVEVLLALLHLLPRCPSVISAFLGLYLKD